MRYVKVTKIISIMLALLTVFLMISSCVKNNGQDEKTSDTTENITESPDSTKVLIGSKEGVSYSLIYPEGVSKSVADKVGDIFRSVKADGGIELSVKDDFLKKNENAAGTPEILFGYTNRAESREVMDSIGYFDWKIDVKGNKVVVAAHTEKALLEAIDYFGNELITYENGNCYLSGQYHCKSSTPVFFGSENKLENYSIVYPAGNTVLEKLAKDLQTSFKRRFDVQLAVKTDAESGEYEILIGAVNRQSVAKYKSGAEALKSFEHFFGADDKKLILFGNSDYSAETALKNFMTYSGLEAPFSYIFNFEAELAKKEPAYLYDSSESTNTDYDIRVMSYNILSQTLSNGQNPYTERCPLWCAEILYRNVDIVGMQEIDSGAYKLITDYIGDTYAFTSRKNEGDKQHSYTSILYNKKTLKLVDSGVINYKMQYNPGGGNVVNQQIRIINWGVFEKKDSGERFIFISTHWNANNYGDVGMNVRSVQAEELTAKVKALVKEYSLPLISTGDFNANAEQSYYRLYLQNTNQSDAAEKAALSITDPTSDNIIDHVTYTANLEAVYYRRVETSMTSKASDHDPVYADLKFVKQ